ncbi:hypothetical protein FRB90_005524 [Tulasnella sp. 427]|nr:hypothetical protein FRB90_005524 [Tulasnella sp. 427]
MSNPLSFNDLPQELVIMIFRLSMENSSHLKTLVQLSLVCRAWKATVDAAPPLWTSINAADGLRHVNNAIQRSGEAPIDLTLWQDDSVSLDDFLQAARTKAAHWRSVALDFDVHPASYGDLETSMCTSLEVLKLSSSAEPVSSQTPTRLFNGGPAPSTLRVLHVFRLPIQLAPMRLFNLSSLVLRRSPTALPMEDIVLVLKKSPTLVHLHLEDLHALHTPTLIDYKPIYLGSLTSSIIRLTTPMTLLLLSIIQTPSLQSADLHFTLDEPTSTSHPLTSPPTTFVPTLRRLLSSAKLIIVDLDCSKIFSIVFGDLEIALEVSDTMGYQRIKDLLDTLMTHLGDDAKALEVRLRITGLDPSLQDLNLVNCGPMVAELCICQVPWSHEVPETIIEALGNPIGSDPTRWLFPKLRIINYRLTTGVHEMLETALQKRYQAAQTQQMLDSDVRHRLSPLKEICLVNKAGSSGWKSQEVKDIRKKFQTMFPEITVSTTIRMP